MVTQYVCMYVCVYATTVSMYLAFQSVVVLVLASAAAVYVGGYLVMCMTSDVANTLVIPPYIHQLRT
jgi:hypothetical protein